MIAIGLDLSLSATGVAVIDTESGYVHAETLRPPKRVVDAGPHDRLAWFRQILGERAREAHVAAIEGPSYGSQGKGRGHHERAGLWWLVTHDLWTGGKPTAVIAPTSVKAFATGKGNSDKDSVLRAADRAFGDNLQGDNNAADALWLAAMTCEHYGHPATPVTAAVRLRALDGVQWPVVAWQS